MLPSPSSQSSTQDKSGKDLTELANPGKFSYLATVLSPPLAEGQTTVASSSTPALASNNTVGVSSAAPAEQPIQWFDADFAPNQSSNQDGFMPYKANTGLSVVTHRSPGGAFCIDCNHCGGSVANEHYHCSICENGDYDLCLQCVGSGVTCKSDDHWLIKRFVNDGIVTNGTTETIAPRTLQAKEAEEEKPAESLPEAQEPAPAVPIPALKNDDRICNSCLKGRSFLFFRLWFSSDLEQSLMIQMWSLVIIARTMIFA